MNVPRSEPRTAQESPIRIFGLDIGGHAINVQACTVDVSEHGARVRGVRDRFDAGQTVGVRHGSEKARYLIVWVGGPGTSCHGHLGLRCVEAGKYIWGIAPPRTAAAGLDSGRFASPLAEPRAAIGLEPAPGPTGNRRKATRYHVTGGAKVQQIGSPAAQWTTLHDLSLGGCYVETTNPLAPDSLVEVVIYVGDIQIGARASVTVAHRLVGMGLKFTEISHLNRTRLEQVMATLTQTASEA